MGSITGEPATAAPQAPLGRSVRVSNWNLTPRRRKETLLPQIIELALEGHSGETIARQVGMPSRTVRHWLRELRQEWIAEAAGGAAELAAVTLARLTAVYREAMEAWRETRADWEVRLVEDTQVADGSRPAKQKRSVRTQPQRRNAALLTRAMAAAKAMFDLKLRAAVPPPKRRLTGPDGKPIPLESLTEEDLRSMSEDELAAIDARFSAAIAAKGGPITDHPALEDLKRMTDAELRAYDARLSAEIAGLDRANDSTRAPPALARNRLRSIGSGSARKSRFGAGFLPPFRFIFASPPREFITLFSPQFFAGDRECFQSCSDNQPDYPR